MNSLKKGEGVPLLNFEGGPGSYFYTMPKLWTKFERKIVALNVLLL